jgi:hypothetical protein
MYRSALAGLAAAVSLASPNHAAAQQFNANFSGFEEVGALNNETGAILSNGTAALHLNLNAASLEYVLIYSGLGSKVEQSISISASITCRAASWCFSARILRHLWESRNPRPARTLVGR